MSEKCADCGSTNLESRDHDLWHYMRNCRDCGARTRYNSKGNVVSVVKGKDRGFKKTPLKHGDYLKSNRTSNLSTGFIDKYNNINDNSGKSKGFIDKYGNINDSSGRNKGFIDSFGNVKDSSGNITGYIDKFGNINKS